MSLSLLTLVQGLRLEPNKYRTFVGMAKSGKADADIINHLKSRGLMDDKAEPIYEAINFFNLANRWFNDRCWRISAGWREFGISIKSILSVGIIEFTAVEKIGGVTYYAYKTDKGYLIVNAEGDNFAYLHLDGRFEEYA